MSATSTLANYDFIGSNVYSSEGNIGIGTTSPSYKLDVNGDTNIAAGSALRFGGTQVCTSTGCTSSSDRNLKENIKSLRMWKKFIPKSSSPILQQT